MLALESALFLECLLKVFILILDKIFLNYFPDIDFKLKAVLFFIFSLAMARA